MTSLTNGFMSVSFGDVLGSSFRLRLFLVNLFLEEFRQALQKSPLPTDHM